MRQADRLSTKIEKSLLYIPDISIQAGYSSPVNVNFLPQNIGYVGALLTWQPVWIGEKNVEQAGPETGALAEKQAALFADLLFAREQIVIDVRFGF